MVFTRVVKEAEKPTLLRFESRQALASCQSCMKALLKAPCVLWTGFMFTGIQGVVQAC